MARPLGAAAALVAALALAIAPPIASASTAPIVTIAGNGQPGPYPGGGSAAGTSVPLGSAAGVAPNTLASGVVFADPADNRILMVSSSGVINPLAGDGTAGYTGDDMSLAPTDAKFRHPKSAASYSDQNFQIGYIIADSTNECTRFAQYGLIPSYMRRDDGGCDPNAAFIDANHFASPDDVEPLIGSGTKGAYYVADAGRVLKITSGSGSILNDPSGSYPPSDNTLLSTAGVGQPTDIAATTTDGDFYIATTDVFGANSRILHVTTDGKVHIAAGGGSSGLGDGSAATSAELDNPSAVVALADGGFLIYDGGHERIRRVSSGGTISTLAGTGVAGSSPDGTPADQAQLRSSGHLAVITQGLVFTQTSAGAGLVREIPATAITSGPAANTTATHAAFTLASWDSAATFACALDGNASSGCGPFDVGEGVHHLVVNATTDNTTRTDNSNVTWTWRVDKTAPAAFGLSEPAGGASVAPKPTFTWQASSDGGSGIDRYELWIDGAKADQTTKCCSIDPVLADGQHTWQVKAIDKAGNVTATATRSFSVIDPPTASLVIAPNPALVGRTVTFDASKSSDVNGSVVDYKWDLDGDGTFETDTGATPTATKSYDKPQTVAVKLRVTDNDGSTGDASGNLVVTTTPPRAKQLGVSINDGAQFTNDPHVTVFAVWPSFASDMLVSNDGGFKNALDFPVGEKTAWTLDSSGPERLPKTIYVRFLGGVQTSETYQDDIILDQTPPKVLAATVTPGPSAARASAAKAKLVTLRVNAKDNVSGVGKLQVTPNKRRPGRFIKYKKTLKVKSAPTLWVRARDRAGNLSRWRKATKR